MITRRKALVTAAGAAAALHSAQAQAVRPNFVYIMADDLGYADLSCYGRRDYQTPNLDRLASQGVRFLQAYANSAVCSATRTALITGRYQYRLEVGLQEPLGTGAQNPGLPPEHPTLPSRLKEAGYDTTLLGKWHLGNLPNFSPLKSGYNHFWGLHNGGVDYFTHKTGIASTDTLDLWDGDTKIEEAGYMTELIGNHAVKALTEYAASRQPFLLSLHFTAPHWPWEGPADEQVSRDLRSITHYDGGSLKTYATMVKALDDQIGRVLQTLESTGLAANTIVVFTSDNGGERFSDTWPFTGKKTELLEGGLRIPAIVRWPGRVAAGSTTDQVALSMDWMPTFLAAAGATPHPDYPLDGMNLLPVVTGQSQSVSRTVFWRYNAMAQRAVRSGNMKFLKIRENTFLFNVADDPLERANLRERMPEEYARLLNLFENWNTAMLPETPRPNAVNNGQLADHFGGAPQPGAAKPKPGGPKPPQQ